MIDEFENQLIDMAKKLQPEFEAKFPQLKDHDVRASRAASQLTVMIVHCTAKTGNGTGVVASFAFDRYDPEHRDDADKLREAFIKRKNDALLDLVILLDR